MSDDLRPLDSGSGYGCPDCGDDLTPCPKCEAPAVELLRTYSLGRHQSMVRVLLAKLSRLRQRVQDAHRHELAAQRAYAESGAAWREATGVLIPAQAQGLRVQLADAHAAIWGLVCAATNCEDAARRSREAGGQFIDRALAQQGDIERLTAERDAMCVELAGVRKRLEQESDR